MAGLPFIGMARERERLARALKARESVLLLGPAGSGKTRLIHECGNDQLLCIGWEKSLHSLLVAMARCLITVRHPELMRRVRPVNGADCEAWLAVQSSVHLKGLLWNAIEHVPIAMALDGITGAGFPAYRFLQKVYHTRGVCLVAAARDVASLGTLGRLFWDPARALNLPALQQRDATRLFECAADHFHLRDLELEEFREKVLESAQGNPGQIIEMCRLATQPQYVSGRYIKFAPLRIDTVIRFGA